MAAKKRSMALDIGEEKLILRALCERRKTMREAGNRRSFRPSERAMAKMEAGEATTLIKRIEKRFDKGAKS